MPDITKVELSEGVEWKTLTSNQEGEFDYKLVGFSSKSLRVYKCNECDYIGKDIESEWEYVEDENMGGDEFERLECPKCHSRDIHPL